MLIWRGFHIFRNPNHIWMRFAFNTALLLAICHTTLWGKSESPSHPSPNSLEWRRWIQGDVTLGGFELRSDFRGSAYGDFNADGWDDILMLTPTRVHVAWNGPDGLGSFQALSEASGEIQHGFWDGASLWVALAYPHRLECWSIGENGTDRRHVWSGRMETLRPCPQGGILVLRNEGTQLVHLQRDGSATTLISDAASCADAALLSSGVLLVQDDASGALGSSETACGATFNGWQARRAPRHGTCSFGQMGKAGCSAATLKTFGFKRSPPVETWTTLGGRTKTCGTSIFGSSPQP